MKILALEKEVPGLKREITDLTLKLKHSRAWELYQDGIIRELYFTQNDHSAVLILECRDSAEAVKYLNTLPLVKEGLIKFEIMPLIPYPGFARLFNK